MTKLALRGLIVVAAALTASVCHAQFGVAWRQVPKVVVVGAEVDTRRAWVDEAIVFWNQALAQAGSAFRLPAAVHAVQPVPEEALQSLSRSIVEAPRGPMFIAGELRSLPGELTIVLGESEFISFASVFFDGGARRVVAIRGMRFAPMSLPNVARNVIVHELGHAIGLGHNSDPSMLMCGRPAACRPGLFRSDEPRIFPLTDDEKRQLLSMYPAPSR